MGAQRIQEVHHVRAPLPDSRRCGPAGGGRQHMDRSDFLRLTGNRFGAAPNCNQPFTMKRFLLAEPKERNRPGHYHEMGVRMGSTQSRLPITGPSH